MTFRLWPQTLAAQLILVTAAALLVSNIAVAFWFERGQQQLTESAVTDRLIDRAISASTLLASIPAKQRAAADWRVLPRSPWWHTACSRAGNAGDSFRSLSARGALYQGVRALPPQLARTSLKKEALS